MYTATYETDWHPEWQDWFFRFPPIRYMKQIIAGFFNSCRVIAGFYASGFT